MSVQLQILIIEDSPEDTELIARCLNSAGCAVKPCRVDNAEDMLQALARQSWDIILADHYLPGFSCTEALPLVRASYPDLPFVIVSGHIGEENAAQAMRAGANDYVMKDNLCRLVPIVERELRESRDKIRRRQEEDAFRKEREFFFVTLASIGDGIISTDLAGRVVFMNRVAEELTGWPFIDARGQRLQQVWSLIDKESGEEIIDFLSAVILTGETMGLKPNSIIRARDGRHHDLSASIAPIMDGQDQIIGVVATFRDITRIKQAEEAISCARDAAENANRTKNRFIANISHEIRTPLNGILGMTELTLDTYLDEEQRDNLLMIRSCSISLMKIVDDILDFSKIEAGKMLIDQNTFSLSNLIGNLVRVMRIQSEERGLSLQYHIDPGVPDWLLGDPKRLQQVLTNLIANGLKFADSGGVKVRVSLGGEQTTDSINLLFAVEDSGIGIEPKDLERLFIGFSQLDGSTTRKYGGTGLGLAISRELVKLMGGDIWVSSRPGVGSTFYFNLPFARGESLAQTKAALTLADEELPHLNILMVDDDRVSLMVTRRMLVNHGHNVDLAINGQEALDILEKQHYDLILMDMQMPVIDGMETTRRIRELEKPQGLHMPIVALTAHALREDRESYLSAGLDFYLSKPFSQEELLKVLQRACGDSPGHLAAPVKENQPSLQALDWGSLLERVNGDEAFVHETMGIFLSDSAQKLENIRNCIKIGDKVGLEKLAHTVKGAASYLSAEQIKSLAFKLELAARKGDFSRASPIFAELVNAFDTLQDKYQAWHAQAQG